jgi:hypothetical protein
MESAGYMVQTTDISTLHLQQTPDCQVDQNTKQTDIVKYKPEIKSFVCRKCNFMFQQHQDYEKQCTQYQCVHVKHRKCCIPGKTNMFGILPVKNTKSQTQYNVEYCKPVKQFQINTSLKDVLIVAMLKQCCNHIFKSGNTVLRYCRWDKRSGNTQITLMTRNRLFKKQG